MGADFVRPNAAILSTKAGLNNLFFVNMRQYLKKLIITPEKHGIAGYTRDGLLSHRLEADDIVRLFNKAGMDHICAIETEGQAGYGVTIVHNYGKHYSVPLGSESAGTHRLFELAGPLLDCVRHGKSMFIDGLDLSLHSCLHEFFIRTFLENTKESQLLFTTQNQDLLDSRSLRNDEIWFVEKDSGGASEFYSLIEFKDIPENASRRGLYKSGAFGAVPVTSSFLRESWEK
jgi:hypothetical protein